MQRVLYFSSTRSQIAICGRILSEIFDVRSAVVQLLHAYRRKKNQ